jgi:hypothetical protein
VKSTNINYNQHFVFRIQEFDALSARETADSIIEQTFERIGISNKDLELITDSFASISAIILASSNEAQSIVSMCPVNDDVPNKLSMFFGL